MLYIFYILYMYNIDILFIYYIPYIFINYVKLEYKNEKICKILYH